MQDLIGKQFQLARNAFQIKDVRNVSGTYMVYAEPKSVKSVGAVTRQAFHLDDIAHLVSSGKSS